MNDERNEFRVAPVQTSGTGRLLPIAAFVVGVFLGAAVFKPWDLVFPARATSPERSGSSVAATSGPTASSSPSGSPAECAFAGGWRVFAVGQPDSLGGDGSTAAETETTAIPSGFADIGNPLRRWLEVDPLTRASGPDDVHIPFVTIVSDLISGIGYCPPPNGADGPPSGARFEAWSLDAAGTAAPMPLRRMAMDGATAIEVEVFIGADQAIGGRPRWPPGRYVFAVAAPDAGRYARWLGVEIRTPPGKSPSPG
jgi:hypothetical protein